MKTIDGQLDSDGLCRRPRRNVLFVDDEELIGQLVAEALSCRGYCVSCCRSGAEALDVLARRCDTIDAMITDQTMPGMTGLALAESVGRLLPDMPIILCTGYTNASIEREAKQAGISAVLPKPIMMKDLTAALDRVLARRAGGRT
jgi:two-component system, cell cycle sensor histidine kinase and response regulator CckA